jgi:hypothetical protein
MSRSKMILRVPHPSRTFAKGGILWSDGEPTESLRY